MGTRWKVAMFSSLVVGYLFCGGAGAGACIVLAVMGLLVPRGRLVTYGSPSDAPGTIAAAEPYRRLFCPAQTIAFGALLVGALMLLGDLGLTERAGLLFALPTPTFLSVGSYALLALIVVSAALSVVWGQLLPFRWSIRLLRILLWASLVLGLVVVSYVGLLLFDMGTVPFWSNVWVPVAFVASALSCGWAVVLACASLDGALQTFSRTLRHGARFDIAVLTLEGFTLAALLATASADPHAVAAQGAEALVSGRYAVLFGIGAVAVGIIVPVAIEAAMLLAPRQKPLAALAVSASLLAGSFALRYCIVAVGAHPEVWTVILQ